MGWVLLNKCITGLLTLVFQPVTFAASSRNNQPPR
jgi:hypothetical protein